MLAPVHNVHAQNLSTSNPTITTFSSTADLPGWVRDIRRFDIITFGIFPFSIFVVTTITDFFRWWENDWDSRYAPFSRLVSAGAAEMTNDEILRTVLISGGVSLAIALVDYFIIRARRENERRRIESMPSGSFEIERSPYGEPKEEPGGEE